jgi:large subunit ribosomal protein L30
MPKKSTPKITVTLVRSPIGYPERQKKTVKALGLRRLNQSIQHNDTEVIRGMVAKVSHLVRIEEGQS